MSPDTEISILIKCVDEATATLKRIEGQMTSSGKAIQQTSENTGNAFTKTQGALLQLGQAAMNVHNIFETYERVNIRLENAQDRVENATIRLKNAQDGLRQATQKLIDIEEKHIRDELTLERAQMNLRKATDNLKKATYQYGKESMEVWDAEINLKEAQYDLSDAQKLGTKKVQELKDAENDLKRKSEEVTISQNNLDIAQRKLVKTINDSKWAYVDMGVQMLSLSAQIPTMLKSLGDLGIGFSGATKNVGGLSGIIGSVGTSLGGWGAAGIAGIAAGGLALIGVAVDDLNTKLKTLEATDKRMQTETIIFGGPLGPGKAVQDQWSSMPATIATANAEIQPQFQKIQEAWTQYGANPMLGTIKQVNTGISLDLPIAFETMKNESLPDIQEVIDAINDIPDEKNVTIKIHTEYV